jgi:hypothetical protein
MKASVERLKRREFAFFLGSLALSWPVLAETEGYKTIDWNDLMPDPWVKEMTKEMAAISKLSYLQDTSDEANKAMNAIRKKAGRSAYSEITDQQKSAASRLCRPLRRRPVRKARVFIGPVFWCLHTYATATCQPNCVGAPHSTKQN